MKNCLLGFLIPPALTLLGACGGPAEKTAFTQSVNAPSRTALANYETRALQLINQERAKQGLRPLRANAKLNKAALEHSMDQSKQAKVTHDGSSLRHNNTRKRITRNGYRAHRWAENVSGPDSGFSAIDHRLHTPESTVAHWLKSDKHRTNIFSSKYRDSGLGHYNGYWTHVFAFPFTYE